MGTAHLSSPFGEAGAARAATLTVPGYVLREAARRGDTVALIDASSGQHLTYYTLATSVRRLASGLYRRFVRHEPRGGWGGGGGVRRPLVCLLASSCLHYPVVLHGVLQAGGGLTTLQPHLSADELTRHFELILPDFIIADHDKIDDARFAASRVGIVKEYIVLGRYLRGHVSVDELLRDDGRAPLGDVTVDCEKDVVLVPFDADSRGEAAGVLHSHGSFNATVAILGSREVAPVSRGEVMVACHQMASMVGLALYCGAALREGATCVILPEVTSQAVLDAATKFKASVLHLTPGVARRLAAPSPQGAPCPPPALRCVYCSGTPLRDDVVAGVMARCGVRELREGFATSGAGAVLSVPRGETRPGSAGQVCPDTEVQIRDILFGGVVALRTLGEVCVRGPQVALGRLGTRRPADGPAPPEDGWLCTGQLGQVDEEGNFSLFGSIDSLIDYNQFQISPIELEHVVLQHPDVEDVVVVGMDNHGAGHVPRAYVMKKSGADVTEADIRDFVADEVLNHKQLRGGVVFVDDVPRAVTGEPLRYKIQAEANRSHNLDISLGDCAQWPPDKTYIEDMRVLQQETCGMGLTRTTAINSLDFSIGKSPADMKDIEDIFEHSTVMFEDDLDGFITTRPKDKTKSPMKHTPDLLPQEEFTSAQHAAAMDSMFGSNEHGASGELPIPVALDDNNNDTEAMAPLAAAEDYADDEDADSLWSYGTVQDDVELSVDCQPPISTSTPMHSPLVHWKKAERRHPVRAVTIFTDSDLDGLTTMEDSSLMGITQNPLSPPHSPTQVVSAKRQALTAVTNKQEQAWIKKVCTKDPLKQEKTRQRRPSLEEAMSLSGELRRKKNSRSPTPGMTSGKSRRNTRGLGGNTWKSTGDLATSTSFSTDLKATPEKTPPKMGDAKFKAAENIRLRAMEYSQQVRRREREKRSGRDYGPSAADSRVAPILHKSPLTGIGKPSPSLMDRYRPSLNQSGSPAYPATRIYPAYPPTKRFDRV